MFKNFKIATKLIITGGLLILIPLIIVSSVAINTAKTGLNNAANEQLSTRSAEIAKLVDNILKNQLKFVTTISIIPLISNTAESIHTNGLENSSKQINILNNYFKKILQTEDLGNQAQLVGMIDLNGQIVSASEKRYLGVKIADREYFQIARSGKRNIGKPAFNKVTKAAFISFAAPVKNTGGKVVGVIFYVYDIGFLQSMIADEKIGKSGYAYIVDQTGLLIAHPNPEHVMKLNLGDVSGMENVVNQMKTGAVGVDRYEFEGISKTAGYAPIKSTGWSVALAESDEEYLATVSKMTTYVVIVTLISIMIAIIGFFLFSHSLVKNIKKAVTFAKTMSGGNLSQHLEIDQKDEIGDLVGSLNEMVDSLSDMIRKIHGGSATLSVTSSELRNVAEVLSVGSGNTADKANTVAAAAEEMNANIESVAAAMEESSTNVNNIAAAVEEMNVGFHEITDNIEKTKKDTNYAAEISNNSSDQISELGKATEEIETITETINTIADKTSLLALNATIEAARAGDAGKGFAVVAGEIKTLAKQVSSSTTDISKKISAIQQMTGNAISGIGDVVEIISQVNRSVDTISISMLQQNDATKEIAENINQTSAGIREINENVTQTSQAVSQVTSEISNVNQSASDISISSTEIEHSSDNLMELADKLSHQVSAFTVENKGFISGPIKLSHSAWKRKLSDLLSNKKQLKETDISSHKDCEFGRWYFSTGMEQFGTNKIFKVIDEKHEKVHTTAKEITRLYNNGEKEASNKLYREFSGVTDVLFKHLDLLEEDTNK